MKKIFIALLLGMFAEITTFILLGSKIGVLPTLLLISLTSIIGAIVMKKMSSKSILSIRQSIARGEAPAGAMVEGVLVLSGAVLLLFPGFISDILAFLLILPLTRKLFLPIIFNYLRKMMSKQTTIVIHQR